MARLFIKNIKGLVGAYRTAPERVSGKEMSNIPVIENAWLAVEDGRILDFGQMEDWPGITDWRDLEVIDAEEKYVLPSWVDSHTHIVFAAPRETEFVDRIHGLSYQEIAAKGGGILNSAAKLAEMREDELFESALRRCQDVMKLGTGALEIKSGYGLSLEAELKMLRVIRRLRDVLPIPVRSTFLGAHAVPRSFNGDTDAYVSHIINEMLPAVTAEGLADFIDVFIEEGYFNVIHGERLLEAGHKYGLRPKIHVNQFSTLGGVALGVKHNALSVDHLEELNEADLEALQGSETIPVALPSCSFFLRIPYTPARTIIDAGLPLALATDFNPGSTPSGNMNFVVSLACIQMRMDPAEAIHAATLNGAAALGISDELGSITPGKRANFIMTKPMSSLAYLPYSFGEDLIEASFVNGMAV